MLLFLDIRVMYVMAKVSFCTLVFCTFVGSIKEFWATLLVERAKGT